MQIHGSSEELKHCGKILKTMKIKITYALKIFSFSVSKSKISVASKRLEKKMSTFPESSCHFCFKGNSKLLIRVFQHVFESSPSPQSCTFPKSLPIKIVLGISKINLFGLLGVVRTPYFFQICLSWVQTRALHVVCGTVCPHNQQRIELLMTLEQIIKLPVPTTHFQAFSLNS